MGEGDKKSPDGDARSFSIDAPAPFCQAILTDTKNVNKAVEYDFIKDWLGDGLLTG